MDWVGASPTAQLALAPNTFSAGYIVLPSAVRTEFTDPTLMRTRGFIRHFALSGFMRGAIGIIEWPDINDVAPAVGEAPLPSSFPDMDWIWWSPLLGLTTDTTGSASALAVREIDSQAMRRLGNRKGILLVIENEIQSTVTVSVNYAIRCLLKDG